MFVGTIENTNIAYEGLLLLTQSGIEHNDHWSPPELLLVEPLNLGPLRPSLHRIIKVPLLQLFSILLNILHRSLLC